MALTQVDWSEKTINGIYTASCSVTATTAENDAYTLKTKGGLDPRKPWQLFYYTSATPDAQALPLDLWIGFGDGFVITGDSTTVAATEGAQFKSVMDDVVLAVTPLIYTFYFDPYLAVADVVTVGAIATGLKCKIPISPFGYAFNADGGSTLAAVTHTYKIVQDQRG